MKPGELYSYTHRELEDKMLGRKVGTLRLRKGFSECFWLSGEIAMYVKVKNGQICLLHGGKIYWIFLGLFKDHFNLLDTPV